MSAPKRTTFEVKVTNTLPDKYVFVKLQATLRYAEKLASFNLNYNALNTFAQRESLNAASDSAQNAYAAADSHEFYDESQQSGSSKATESSSSAKNVSANAEYGAFSASVDYAKKNASASTNESSYSNHAVHSGKTASSLSTANAASNAFTNMSNDVNANESEMKSQEYSQSTLMNKTVEPGFVRIRPAQTLDIPVVVESESQVVYLSVFVTDFKNGDMMCVANQLQINVQHVQITEQKDGGIGIEPIIKKNDGFRRQLEKWGIPSALGDCMEMCGWSNPRLWHEIRDSDLKRMGFKKGHIIKFNNGYSKWKQTQNWLSDDITFKSLFERWGLPDFLCDNLIQHGWSDMKFWKFLTDDEELKRLGFQRGHIVVFRHYTKDDQHLQEFQKLKVEFEQKSRNDDVLKDDVDDEYDIKQLQIEFNLQNITHNTVDVELLNEIRFNEYYVVELCQKPPDEATQQDYKWRHVLTIKSGNVHRIKLEKMSTVYLVRVKAYNHEDRVSSNYTTNSFKSKDKEWMIQHMKPMKQFRYTVDLVYADKLDFVWIDFDGKDIQRLGDDKEDNNTYYVEFAKETKHEDEKEKEQELKWDKVVRLNDKQSKYMIAYTVSPDFKSLVRITSVNEFDYVQCSKQVKTVRISSMYHHPSQVCREEWKHPKGIEWFHPKTTLNLLQCKGCGSSDVEYYWYQKYDRRSSDNLQDLGLKCATCNKVYEDRKWTCEKTTDFSKKSVHGCCMQANGSSGCKQRYKCCGGTTLNERGCVRYYYHNCCNRERNSAGCVHKYVCNT